MRSRIGRWLIALMIGSLSAGWIVPLYLGVAAYLTGFEHLLRGTENQNSFPYFLFAGGALRFGFMWCLASAIWWMTYGVYRLLRPPDHG